MERIERIGRSRQKRLVLIVEDNDMMREMLEAILSEDYDIVTAADGGEGLIELEHNHERLSLVLLDLYMPEADGFKFLEEKGRDERFGTIPVIVATASASQEDEKKCLELGANDFVVKPYNFDIISNRIGNMIKLRESAALVNQLSVDRVTKLYTKEFFNKAVESALKSPHEGGYDVACADIENFKSLNDRYGEQKCDGILRDLAEALSGTIPGLVAAGRIGGDSFAFLLEHRERGWEESLVAAVQSIPIAHLNVKFGVFENIDADMTASQICDRAMSALDTLRARHGSGVAFFDNELHEQQVMEQRIRESMEAAIGEFQFSVFYQPKHDVRTDHVGGAEALVRWFHPEIGFISPGLFIPIFERNGFITTLDLFVWEEACKEVKRCQDLGLPTVPISVNASRLDFDVPDLPARIADLADKYGIDHGLLHIELTESAYSDDPDCVTRMLEEIKALGFATELDDFGAGYSSLVSLNLLPLDVMKLDMSMVQHATELGDFRIVESTIKLAQVLGLTTVVEGVETEEEAEKVKAMGCDLIQGYYYSKPLNRDEFEAYLQAQADREAN